MMQMQWLLLMGQTPSNSHLTALDQLLSQAGQQASIRSAPTIRQRLSKQRHSQRSSVGAQSLTSSGGGEASFGDDRWAAPRLGRVSDRLGVIRHLQILRSEEVRKSLEELDAVLREYDEEEDDCEGDRRAVDLNAIQRAATAGSAMQVAAYCAAGQPRCPTVRARLRADGGLRRFCLPPMPQQPAVPPSCSSFGRRCDAEPQRSQQQQQPPQQPNKPSVPKRTPGTCLSTRTGQQLSPSSPPLPPPSSEDVQLPSPPTPQPQAAAAAAEAEIETDVPSVSEILSRFNRAPSQTSKTPQSLQPVPQAAKAPPPLQPVPTEFKGAATVSAGPTGFKGATPAGPHNFKGTTPTGPTNFKGAGATGGATDFKGAATAPAGPTNFKGAATNNGCRPSARLSRCCCCYIDFWNAIATANAAAAAPARSSATAPNGATSASSDCSAVVAASSRLPVASPSKPLVAVKKGD
uniref:Smoothelin domain-containing protein n=1 Tax=Macrostomum lignano TaxID=282301 RepID=A0A1I8JLF7_9PLAT